MEEAPPMTLAELWERFLMLETDLKEEEVKDWASIRDIVKEGIKIKVSIYYIIGGHYEEHPKDNLVLVHGFGKYGLADWNEEITKRKVAIMKAMEELTGQLPWEAEGTD